MFLHNVQNTHEPAIYIKKIKWKFINIKLIFSEKMFFKSTVGQGYR